jgi:hypothetical protein
MWIGCIVAEVLKPQQCQADQKDFSRHSYEIANIYTPGPANDLSA